MVTEATVIIITNRDSNPKRIRAKITTSFSASKETQLKIRLRKHLRSWLSSFIRTKIRKTLIQQRLSSKKLQMLMRLSQMRRREKHMMSLEKKGSNSRNKAVEDLPLIWTTSLSNSLVEQDSMEVQVAEDSNFILTLVALEEDFINSRSKNSRTFSKPQM